MALRLRRGTDAERQLIIPLEGELIYTTDTKLLYVGDGTAVGGTLVTGSGGGSTTLDGLTDTNLAGVTNGDVLAYNSETNQWEPAEVAGGGGSTTLDGLTDTNLAGVTNGDVLAYNSETNQWEPGEVPGLSEFSLVDLDDVVINSSAVLPGHVLTWDETGIWTSKPIATVFEEQQNYKINIVGDDSTIIINIDTNDVTGNFFGDLIGDVVGNVTGNVTGDVIGDLIGNVSGDVIGSIFGNDSSLLVDGINGSFFGDLIGDVSGNVTGNVTGNVIGDITGDLIGNVRGDVNGSIFGDDSSLLVDGINGSFFGTLLTGTLLIDNNVISSDDFLLLGSAEAPLEIIGSLRENFVLKQTMRPEGGSGFIVLDQIGGTFELQQAVEAGDEIGGILIRASTSSVDIGVAATIGCIVDPTAVISDTGHVKSIVAILASDDTSSNEGNALLIDSSGVATSNAFVANKYFQLPVYADDAARTTAIPAPAAGMMIFMTLGTTPSATNQMQVFDGVNWVNAS